MPPAHLQRKPALCQKKRLPNIRLQAARGSSASIPPATSSATRSRSILLALSEERPSTSLSRA